MDINHKYDRHSVPASFGIQGHELEKRLSEFLIKQRELKEKGEIPDHESAESGVIASIVRHFDTIEEVTMALYYYIRFLQSYEDDMLFKEMHLARMNKGIKKLGRDRRVLAASALVLIGALIGISLSALLFI